MGGASNRRKGAQWEQQVVAYLREHGLPHAQRSIDGGHTEMGDVTG